MHIVQSESIRPKRTHRCRMHETITAGRHHPAPVAVVRLECPVGPVRVRALRRDVIAPVARRADTPASRVFPLRLARQAIPFPRLLREPIHVRLRIIPIHAHYRVHIRLLKPRGCATSRASSLFALRFPDIPVRTTAIHTSSRRAHKRPELAPRHLIFAHGKGVGDRHAAAGAGFG